MISSKPRPAAGVAKNIAGRSVRKPATIAISAFLLASTFTLGAAPTAAAATLVGNNGMVAYWDPDQCRGNKPGVCIPDNYVNPLNQQGTMLPDHQIITHQSRSPQR
jgi:hypothetical protein